MVFLGFDYDDLKLPFLKQNWEAILWVFVISLRFSMVFLVLILLLIGFDWETCDDRDEEEEMLRKV